jgi:flagellar motor switch protein FliM
MSDTLPRFDFRTAGTSDLVVRSLKQWLTKTAGTFADGWEAVSDTEVALECESILSRTFEDGLQYTSAESIGCKIFLGEARIPTLACVSIRDLVSLIGCVLGTGPVTELVSRKMTSIELSLCELIFESLASSLSSAWSGHQPLPIAVGGFEETPQYSRLISIKELVFCIRLDLRVTEANAAVLWLCPRKEVQALVEQVVGARSWSGGQSSERRVRRIGLDVVAMLGRANMTMGALTELKVGDLVLLDQKIDEPLEVTVDRQRFFMGWPGRIGQRQAIEIAKVT